MQYTSVVGIRIENRISGGGWRGDGMALWPPGRRSVGRLYTIMECASSAGGRFVSVWSGGCGVRRVVFRSTEGCYWPRRLNIRLPPPSPPSPLLPPSPTLPPYRRPYRYHGHRSTRSRRSSSVIIIMPALRVFMRSSLRWYWFSCFFPCFRTQLVI